MAKFTLLLVLVIYIGIYPATVQAVNTELKSKEYHSCLDSLKSITNSTEIVKHTQDKYLAVQSDSSKIDSTRFKGLPAAALTLGIGTFFFDVLAVSNGLGTVSFWLAIPAMILGTISLIRSIKSKSKTGVIKSAIGLGLILLIGLLFAFYPPITFFYVPPLIAIILSTIKIKKMMKKGNVIHKEKLNTLFVLLILGLLVLFLPAMFFRLILIFGI